MLFPIPRYPVLRVILSLETFLDINVPRPEGQLKQGIRTSKFKFSYYRNPSQNLKIWSHLNSEHGDLVRLDIPGRGPTVLVFDPDVAEKVYRHEGARPQRPAFFCLREAKRMDKEPASLQGILSSNGETWSKFRRAIQVLCYNIIYCERIMTDLGSPDETELHRQAS